MRMLATAAGVAGAALLILVATIVGAAMALDGDTTMAAVAGTTASADEVKAAAHRPDHNTALPLASFWGKVPANADELAKSH